MSEQVEIPQQQPFYADPEYWDGHMIGDGKEQSIHVTRKEAFAVGVKFGLKDMHARLASKLSAIDLQPVSILREGQEFCVEEYGNDSVFLFSRETLRKGRESDEPPSDEQQEEGEILVKPAKSNGRLPQHNSQHDFETEPLIDISADFAYTKIATWGLLRHSGTRSIMQTCPAFLVRLNNNRLAIKPSVVHRLGAPVLKDVFNNNVGSVQHFGISISLFKTSSAEELSRINQIEVYSTGSKKKDKSRKLARGTASNLGRFSTGHAAA